MAGNDNAKYWVEKVTETVHKTDCDSGIPMETSTDKQAVSGNLGTYQEAKSLADKLQTEHKLASTPDRVEYTVRVEYDRGEVK